MMKTGTLWTWIPMLFAAGLGAAQQAPPQPAPAPAAAAVTDQSTAATSPRSTTPSKPMTPAKLAPAAMSAQIEAGEPRATGTAHTSSGAPGTGGAKSPGAVDRLNLGTATVTGDHEQPKVMYVVPWKSANIGDLSGKPMNSLLDEALAPVDREEFKREVAYYDAVKAAPANGASPSAAQQGEK